MKINMKIITHTFSDGYAVSMRYWQGDGRGVILYIHGIQSHGLWFEQSASVLANEGFSVLLPDRRGSGLNEIARGDVNNFGRWIDDMVELIDWLGAKVHIVSVSWGGKLAMGLAKSAYEKMASITLIAPGIFPVVDVPVSRKLQIAADVILRTKRKFPIPLNAPELFTENSERQDFIRNDNLKLTSVTGRFMYQSRRLDRFIRFLPNRLNIPAKLFLAGRDKIIDNQKTLNYFRSLRCAKRKSLACFPQACHTLEFESDNRQFLNELKEWIISCEDI